MSLAECKLVITRLHGPYICHSPWSNDLDIRSKCLDTQFKTDLIVTFTGSTVADGNGVFLTCDFDKLFGDSRTCHRSSEQIFVFIYSTGLYTWHDIVFTEIIYDVFNIQLGSTGKFGSLIQTIQFVTLSAVYTAADNFVIKCFFQPWDQCCGVKTA